MLLLVISLCSHTSYTLLGIVLIFRLHNHGGPTILPPTGVTCSPTPIPLSKPITTSVHWWYTLCQHTCGLLIAICDGCRHNIHGDGSWLYPTFNINPVPMTCFGHPLGVTTLVPWSSSWCDNPCTLVILLMWQPLHLGHPLDVTTLGPWSSSWCDNPCTLVILLMWQPLHLGHPLDVTTLVPWSSSWCDNPCTLVILLMWQPLYLGHPFDVTTLVP